MPMHSKARASRSTAALVGLSPPVSYMARSWSNSLASWGIWSITGSYLRRCGATDTEASFLVAGGYSGGWVGQRVELDAMSSEQFIGWIEGKLQEHGVAKVRPEGNALKAAYERAVRLQAFEAKVEEASKGFWDANLDPYPDDLGARIDARLRRWPAMAWDEALWQEVEGGQGR